MATGILGLQPGLPPGLRGFVTGQEMGQRQQAAQLAQLQGILGLQAAMEQQAAAREMRPLQIEALRGQAADRDAQARLREAQILDMQRRAAAAQDQQAAMGQLAGVLSGGFQGVPGQEGPLAPPTGVMMNEQSALQAAIEADKRGEQVRIDVPNPAVVQGLAVRADPQHAIPELLRQQRAPTPARTQDIIPVAGGFIDRSSGQPVFTRTAPEPNPAPDPLVAVKDPKTGKPVMLRRSQAEGMEPASLSGREDDINVRRLMQFGGVMEKAGFPQAYATLEEAQQKITPASLKYLTGPAGYIPDAALSREVTDARQALQRLLNITLKDRSGAAVTNPEWERFKKEAGVGLLKNPEQISEWLGQAKTILDKHYAGVAAGFPEDIRNRYFEEMGKVSPFGTTKAGGAAPGWSDDKERRYQELLRKRNAP